MNSSGVIIIDFVLIPSSFVVRTIRTEEGQVMVLMVPMSWWSAGVSILNVVRPPTTGIRQRSTKYRVASCRHLHVVSSVDLIRQSTTTSKSTSSSSSTVDCRWTHRPVTYNDRYIDCWLDFIISLWLTIFPHLLFIDYPALSEIKGNCIDVVNINVVLIYLIFETVSCYVISLSLTEINRNTSPRVFAIAFQ